MKPTFFTRVLAGILSITMVCLPLHGVAADVQRQSGLSGQQEGKQLLQNWTMPALNGNTLSVPLRIPAKLNSHSGQREHPDP